MTAPKIAREGTTAVATSPRAAPNNGAALTEASQPATVLQAFTPDTASPPPSNVEVTRRKASRETLIDEGIEAAREALAVIRQTFSDKGADFDDAVKALPAVHRIIEHAEKLEAQQRHGQTGWPPLHFTLVLDAGVAQIAPPKRPKASTEVVDITAR